VLQSSSILWKLLRLIFCEKNIAADVATSQNGWRLDLARHRVKWPWEGRLEEEIKRFVTVATSAKDSLADKPIPLVRIAITCISACHVYYIYLYLLNDWWPGDEHGFANLWVRLRDCARARVPGLPLCFPVRLIYALALRCNARPPIEACRRTCICNSYGRVVLYSFVNDCCSNLGLPSNFVEVFQAQTQINDGSGRE
jgi:hypothetical protein